MRVRDVVRFAFQALYGHGLRTGLSVLGVVIGVAAVIVLTALTDGARVYVVNQFANLGTNLVIAMPGRTETTGVPGPVGVPNDLTLDDAESIVRQIGVVRRVAPMSMGTDSVSFGERSRQVAIVGTTHDYLDIRQLDMARGEFLPEDESSRGRAVVVLGHKLARELFPGVDPVGKIVRIADWRMRVIGVFAPQGVNLGIDFDETAVIPVATGMKMLNRSSLFRILIESRSHDGLDFVREQVRDLLIERHGEEDFTVITQDAVLATFSAILNVLTLGLAAIAAISLTVAGIGIMNVMLVSVSERTREIGLLAAIGAGRRQILAAFVIEAAILSTLGGLLGLAVGFGLVRILTAVYPDFPAAPPDWAIVAALATSILVGVVFGFLPARRASRLDPVAALAGR